MWYYVFRVIDNKLVLTNENITINISLRLIAIHKYSGFHNFPILSVVGNMFVPSLSIDLFGLQR